MELRGIANEEEMNEVLRVERREVLVHASVEPAQLVEQQRLIIKAS